MIAIKLTALMAAALMAAAPVPEAPGAGPTPADSTASETDLELRLNPEMDSESDAADDDIVVPRYIRHLPIEFNGDDWSGLRRKTTGGTPFNIVHIGDSHLQADIATQLTRELLQYDFGNAGRGLVTPLRLSGTNEPWNYSFKSDIKWRADQLMKMPWSDMGFTGCAISAVYPRGYIELSTSDRNDWNPFDYVTLYHTGGLEIDRVTDGEGNELDHDVTANERSTSISLDHAERLIRIHLKGEGKLTIYGAYLGTGRPGLVYNVIGNNGATFQSYNRIEGFSSELAALKPSLVILSLGCNEAFGRFDEFSFLSQIDRLVKSIELSNPGVKILLTTPMECHRRQTVRTKARRGRRSRTRTTSSFTVNTNVKEVARAIRNYGKRHNIAVYDFYEAAGGDGAADRWVADGLYSRDHIHLSGKGYKLQGQLLYEALSKALQQGKNKKENAR